jgi:predicted TIM-barrel fold metal-dependent hydrolase
MSAIDVHAHYLPPSYRAALARAGVDRPDGFPYVPSWSAASAISIMDEAAIGAALLSVSSPGLHFLPADERPELARAVNSEGAEAVREHPRRLGLLASLPLPDVDAALEEIAHAADVLKSDGFVLMSNYDGVYLGDPRLDPVMAELDGRRALVAIHPTSPAGAELTDLGRPRPMIEFPIDTTRAVVNLILSGSLERNAAIRMVVPHVGSALTVLADRVQGFTSAFGESRDVFAALRSLWFDITGDPFPNALAALMRIADPSRILYGSDTPFAPAPVIARSARALREAELLTKEQRAGVLRENALVLVPRLGA